MKKSHDPFSGDIDEEGRVRGRGTVDTRGSLFCIFTALEELTAQGVTPDGDVYIASSCTEEISGDGTSKQFQLVERITNEIFPGVVVTPYTMTGGTYAKFYKDICPNCIRFAPLYINKQQYGSIHALNENLHQGVLPHAVEFYKQVILRAREMN